MLLISVKKLPETLKSAPNLSSFKSGVKTFLFVTSLPLFCVCTLTVMAMMMGTGGDSNCGGGGDIDGGDDVFPIDVCLCHMQLTVWILMIVSHYLFLMFF